MAELNGVPASADQIRTLALTNYGHFTSMRVDNGRVRGLSLHLERLTRDCGKLFSAELDADWVRHLVRRSLLNTAGEVVVRITVFDPSLDLGHPGADLSPHVLITSRQPAPPAQPPLRLELARYAREMPEVKHVGLFGSLMHRRRAQMNGFDDVVFTDIEGVISELATSNVGFVDGDHLIWPEADCLQGVTMRLIRQALDAEVITTRVKVEDLSNVQAVFATNAVTGIRPIQCVGNNRWSDQSPVIDMLRRAYGDIPPERI